MVRTPARENSGRDKPSVTAVHPRWWQLEAEEKAREICSIVDGLETDQKPRVSRYTSLTSLYEIRPLAGLTAAAYDASDAMYDDIYVPLARSLCDTAQANIAGRQRVKAQFSTTGADWKTQRRTKKLDRFVEAVMHLEQGTYLNGWELCDDAFLDEAIIGVGVTRAYVDDSTGKPRVILERMRPGRLKVDPREAEKGDPQNYFWDDWADEDHLLAHYADNPELDIDDDERERRRNAIQNAAIADASVTLEQHGSTRIARSVLVRYAVRLPIGAKKPGQFAIAVPQALLYESDYGRHAPPAVVWRWSRERCGFWGIGLVEETRSIVAEYNNSVERLQERMQLCANKRTYVPQGSVTKEDMQENEAETIVEFTGTQPPVETVTPPFTPQEVEYLQMIKQAAYETPGISQMSATGRKEQGVTAAVAIRTVIDVASQRFAIKARYGYEYPFIAMAKQIVYACAEYVEETGNDIEVSLPTKRGARTIKWSEAKMDLDSLVVQLSPGSSLPDDYAGRLQEISEAFQMGLITQAQYKRLREWPDLAKETDRENAETEYLEDLLDRYMEAEEGDESFRYEPPDGYIMDKAAAMVQVIQTYFVEKRNGAPEFNLGLLRNYMLQLGEAIDRATQPSPQDQTAAGVAGPTPPMAGGTAPQSPIVGPTAVPSAA